MQGLQFNKNVSCNCLFVAFTSFKVLDRQQLCCSWPY